MDAIKTHISGLDKVLGGGIPKNSIITLSGAPGTGKSILGMQFIIEGIKKSGENGLYIIIEESRESLTLHMESVGWNIKNLEELRQLVILDYPPTEVEQFTIKSNPIKEIIENAGITRVVIDSIMPIALSYSDEYERKKEFIKFIENIRQWKATTLILSDSFNTNYKEALPYTKYGIETLSDGWINLYYTWEKDERIKSLEVIKMKGMAHSSSLHEFSLGKGGIKVKE